MNLMGATIVDIDIELRMKISRKKCLESRLICDYVILFQYKGLLYV